MWLAKVPILGDKATISSPRATIGLMTPLLNSPSLLPSSPPLTSPSFISNTVRLAIHQQYYPKSKSINSAPHLSAFFTMHGDDCPKCGAASDGGKTCSSCGAVSTTSAISLMPWPIANIYLFAELPRLNRKPSLLA
jgi:hypothetical protein